MARTGPRPPSLRGRVAAAIAPSSSADAFALGQQDERRTLLRSIGAVDATALPHALDERVQAMLNLARAQCYAGAHVEAMGHGGVDVELRVDEEGDVSLELAADGIDFAGTLTRRAGVSLSVRSIDDVEAIATTLLAATAKLRAAPGAHGAPVPPVAAAQQEARYVADPILRDRYTARAVSRGCGSPSPRDAHGTVSVPIVRDMPEHGLRAGDVIVVRPDGVASAVRRLSGELTAWVRSHVRECEREGA